MSDTPEKSVSIHQRHPRARLVKARAATFVCFFLTGYMLYVWSTGTVALRNHLGITGAGGDAAFGTIATAIGLGSVVGCYGVGPLIDRFGARTVTSVVMLLYPLSIIPMAFTNSLIVAVLIGVALGILRGGIDTSMNAHGVQVERLYGRPIMLAFHASYPLGGFVAGIIGSALAGEFTETPLVPYLVMSGAILVAAIVVQRWLLTEDEVLPPETGEIPTVQSKPRKHERGTFTRWNWASIAVMLGFGVLALAAMLGEGAVADWGQEFVSRERETTAQLAGVAVTLFTGAQCIGRFVGDRLNLLFGSVKFVMILGTIALIGVVLMSLPSPVWVTLIGFTVFGLGTSSITPLMVSSAGRYDPKNVGRNIGIVNSIGYAGMLLGPLGISVIVTTMGLNWMTLLPGILIVGVMLAGPFLLKKVPTYSGEDE